MRIKTRFSITIWVSVLLLVIGLVFTISGISQVKSIHDDFIRYDNILRDLNEIRMLTLEYVNSPSERKEEQWNAGYQIIKVNLFNSTPPQEIQEAYKNISAIFEQIAINAHNFSMEDRKSIHYRFQQQLYSTLLVETQRIIDWDRRLSNNRQSQLKNKINLYSTGALILLATVSILTAIMLVISRKRIMYSISTLEHGVNLLSGGNLQHTIDLQTNDEFSEFAAAFNSMTTDLKLRDERLIESSLLNQQIINSANEGIIVYDRNLCYKVWNPFMEKLSGLKAEDVIGKNPVEVFPFLKEKGVIDRLKKILKGENVEPIEFPFPIQESGKSGWTSDSSAPFLNNKGEIIGVIGTVRDISDQKTIEEQLRQSQKMEAIGQLAGGVAHDFNNILTVIIGYANLLNMDQELNDPQKKKVNFIIEASDRAAQLTQGLLAFSRKQVMHTKQAELNEIVHNVEKFLVRVIGEDITLKLALAKDVLPVHVDVGQIEQVLINLATNARDAMQSGGLLSIETRKHDVDLCQGHQYGDIPPGHYACISVLDTGCGMDGNTQSRIFEPFFTTKSVGKGTGLGMSIVYGIIKQHNGFIHIYSEPGHGTTFRIFLPLAEEESANQQGHTQIAPPAKGDETILVAEDDSVVRELIESILTKFGYTVILAVDGNDAVDKFTENRDRIDLILMDMIMPGKNGKEALDDIRNIQPDVKAIFVSGYTSDFIDKHGRLNVEVKLLMKPINPSDLLRNVREILDLPRSLGD